MRYVIAIVVVLALSFFFGFVLGAIQSDLEEGEQEREDSEQIEFLKEWENRHRRS